MELALVAQAVAVAEMGPLAPYRILICPAAMFTMTAGMKKGEIFRGPPASRFECSRSIISNPPMPEPMKTPTRSAISSVILRPDWAIAS